MQHDQRRLRLRLARDLQVIYERRPAKIAEELPQALWEGCRRLQQRLQHALEHGHLVAAEMYRARLAMEVDWCWQRCRDFAKRLREERLSPPQPSLRMLDEELVAIEDEFEEVIVDRGANTIGVRTEPICLGDLELGPFDIVLRYQLLWDQNRPYEVIACEPHPAASASHITHPHVNSEVLCEGDGRAAIKAAREQGRLLDFFLLVRQVLRTYNDGSAYVSLDNWHGLNCNGCGDVVPPDETYACTNCGNCSRHAP